MTPHAVFLTVGLVARNRGAALLPLLQQATTLLPQLATDYELVVVDNASSDDSVARLRQIVDAQQIPNLQVYALTQEVLPDVGEWVVLENALGDYVVVLDPGAHDLSPLPELLDRALSGADIVTVQNQTRPRQSPLYRMAWWAFRQLYRSLNGVDLQRASTHYQLLSRRVVNFLAQHPHPTLAYRQLFAMAGFNRAQLSYRSAPLPPARKRVGEHIDRGMRLLVSSTRGPMRLVTTLSLFGAVSNLIYSIYVVFIALFKADVEPGWTSLSLQQSGMFFLISLVLLVLGEYILHMTRLSTDGPAYHIAQEFASATRGRDTRLNVEEARALSASRVV